MDGLHVPSAAPWKQHFGEEEFWVEPLTLRDWATLEKRFIESRPDPIDLAKAKLDGLEPAQKRELLELALRQTIEQNRATTQEIKRFIRAPAGMALMLWLSLRKHHPEITEQRAHELLATLGEKQLASLEAKVQGEPAGEGLAKN